MAILGVGRDVDQTTRGDSESVVWRKVLTLSITLDHHTVEGAPGAAFLETASEILGSPDLLGATR